MTVRPAHPDDAEATAGLRRTVFPYLVRGAAQKRRMLEEPSPAELRRTLVAEAGGEIVGWASAGLNVGTTETGAANLTLYVAPDHRRQGHGGELLDAARAHLRDLAARRVRVFATEDSVDFARARGFEPSRAVRFSGVDVGELPATPVTPPGLDVVPFLDVDAHTAYLADVAATADEPGDMAPQVVPFDEWHREIWTAPALDHALSVGVLDGDEMVAFTAVETDGDRAWSGMTGTVASHRGRGLAKLAKSVALHRAAAAGVTTAFTANDDSNAPMLAINRWLGYRLVATAWSCLTPGH